MAEVHEVQSLVVLQFDAVGQVVEHQGLENLPDPVVLHEAPQAKAGEADVEQSEREGERGEALLTLVEVPLLLDNLQRPSQAVLLLRGAERGRAFEAHRGGSPVPACPPE